MDIKTFWVLIDATREASARNVSKQADLLLQALVQLSADEILAFHVIMEELLNKAYDAALWDAADIIGCGCGDDGFSDFRAWLIAQGKEVYEKALADPESLVDLIEINDNARAEDLLYVAMDAYKQRTGQDIPSQHRERPVLKGKRWPEESRKARFPKLAAKFGDCEQRWAMWLSG